MVFPMHMGMNHVKVSKFNVWKCVPHAHGDEPQFLIIFGMFREVFPMHMGMNRAQAPYQ